MASSTIPRILFVLNSNQTKRSICVYNKPSIDFKTLKKLSKSKLHVRRRPERFFELATGDEILPHQIVTGKDCINNELGILVSFGEDFVGQKKIVTGRHETREQYFLPFTRSLYQERIAEEIRKFDALNSVGRDHRAEIASIVASYFPDFQPMESSTLKKISQSDRKMKKASKKGSDKFNEVYHLETRDIYSAICEEVENDAKEVPAPTGLVTCNLSRQEELLQQAQLQVDSIFQILLEKRKQLKASSNLKFYINTPYYSRNSRDLWPMFSRDDERISAIMSLVRLSTQSFGFNLEDRDLDRLNIIVRQYRLGDVLGFHSDRAEFGDEIFGLVLRNNDKHQNGLALYQKDWQPFVSKEFPGLAWRLTADSRWVWKHGLASPTHGSGYVRTSVTFRFFTEKSIIPNYNHENDI